MIDAGEVLFRVLLRTVLIILVLVGLLPSESVVLAQKPKWAHAIERSADAGRIISLLALVPDSGLPKELVDKAEAVAVFPKVRKETALFTHVSQGYGVISVRHDGGWSLPAFYQFSGGGYGNPLAKNEASAVVLLFMTKDALGWFEKGGVPLKNEKKAVAGPVGEITDAQRKELEEAQILAYSYYNGKLDGTAFGKSFWKKFALNPDNNINTPMYGMKGREVLAGKQVDPSKVRLVSLLIRKHWRSITLNRFAWCGLLQNQQRSTNSHEAARNALLVLTAWKEHLNGSRLRLL